MDLRQQYRAMSLDVLKATLERGKLNEEEAAMCLEVIEEKAGRLDDSQQPSGNESSSTIDDYKTGITIAKFISFVGWLVVIGSIGFVGFLFYQSANMFQYARGETVFLGVMGILGSGLGVMISGLLLVIGGQASRAVMDNANYSCQMLEFMKKQG